MTCEREEIRAYRAMTMSSSSKKVEIPHLNIHTRENNERNVEHGSINVDLLQTILRYFASKIIGKEIQLHDIVFWT